MGLSDVQRHIATSIHERFAKDSRSQTTLSFPSSSSPVFEKVNFHMNYVLLLMTIAQLSRKVCTYTFSGYKNLSIACIVSDICYLLYRNQLSRSVIVLLYFVWPFAILKNEFKIFNGVSPFCF